MPTFSADKLALWSGGTWNQRPLQPLLGVYHDTRTLRAGSMYVALAGERFDGHRFLPQAHELGAAAALVRRGQAVEFLPCLEVQDPLPALQAIAAGHRRELGGLLVGVTGSVGKTTVKDLIADMLSRRGRTARTPGNWNNHIGLPLSLLGMESEDDFGVFEVGMNRPGEIAPLSRLLSPLCGVVTSIGAAHIEAFDSVEAIAREKCALLEALPPEGVAVLYTGSPWFSFCRASTPARVVTCSLEDDAEFSGHWDQDAHTLELHTPNSGSFTLELPLPGKYMAVNVLQAAATACSFGISGAEIQTALDSFAPASMRWQEVGVAGFSVINDAYNANPLSMRSAIKTFAGVSPGRDKWLVLGSMRELGGHSVLEHRAIGSLISTGSWAGLITVGDMAAAIADVVEEQGGDVAALHRVHDVQEAAACLRREARTGAMILLKASRGDRLERVVQALEQSHTGA